jgi:hypothetical protein
MERSRKFFLTALIILLIAQFFDYGFATDTAYLFNWIWKGRRFVSYSYAVTGWERNSWFDAAIPIFIYLFYKSPRKTWVYIIGFCFIVLLGWAGEFGGTMGFISIVIAAYALYLRFKETKKSNPATKS